MEFLFGAAIGAIFGAAIYGYFVKSLSISFQIVKDSGEQS